MPVHAPTVCRGQGGAKLKLYANVMMLERAWKSNRMNLIAGYAGRLAGRDRGKRAVTRYQELQSPASAKPASIDRQLGSRLRDTKCNENSSIH